MHKTRLKIGTRSSALALAQAREVGKALQRAHNLSPDAIEIVPMSTRGDRLLDQSLKELGGKGLFTREIEAALLENRIDIAVHSAKDMPAELPRGLHLSAFLPRADPRDVFIGRQCRTPAELPQFAVVGTSSVRRRALLLRLRPDIKTVLLRGNVQTRLDKLANGAADGTFLAYAGLQRLGLIDKATAILETHNFIPAPAQGVIAIESRIHDTATEALLAAVHDTATEITTVCERRFMADLDGSCRTPLGAYARINGQYLHLHAAIISLDGTVFHEVFLEKKLGKDTVKTAHALGKQAAQILGERAGETFFRAWQDNGNSRKHGT